MAKKYGYPESVQELLKKRDCRRLSIKKFKDVEDTDEELGKELEERKEKFYDEVPDVIDEKKQELEDIRSEKKEKLSRISGKLDDLRQKIDKNKSSREIVSLIVNFFKAQKVKIKGAWAKRKAKKAEQEKQREISRWEDNPEEIFEERNKELIRKKETVERIKDSSDYSGALGELKALKELSKLGDEYRVLCGLNIRLNKYITYNGERNLKSAQMDFVVVSKKGVFLLEVKNWSNKYCKNNKGLSPHEQVSRAGRVLYVFLKSKLGIGGKALTSLLVPIQNNMSYDSNYKHVLVKSISNLNNFITNQEGVYTDSEIQKVVGTLKPHITKKSNDYALQEDLKSL